MMKMNRSSLSLKITLLALSSLVVCALIVGAISYALHRGDTISSHGERALALARAAALAVDPDEFVSLLQSGEKNDYWYEYKAFLDALHQENDLLYLYALDKDYASEVTYFAEGFDPVTNAGEENVDLGETESVVHHDQNLFDTIDTGMDSKTGLYTSEDYGSMVSGFAPIKNKAGQVIGVVGADIDISDVVAASNRFGLMILGIAAGLCLMAAFLMIRYMRRRVGIPMRALSAASNKLALGDMDVNVSVHSSDEIGHLARSFQNMIDSTNKQVAALEKISQKDLTADITPRCVNDQMSIAMGRTVDHLNKMLLNIQSSSNEVSLGAKQVSDDAQSLAQGTAQQAAAIERFSDVIGHMADKTKENAQLAGKASVLAGNIKENAEKGAQQMSQMTQAVQEINDASQSISNVMTVIDNIAFQTNILALNAAVEAARAGQHGKGFAVVAEEVRSLANKSAQAARDTSLLITNSMEKAELGARIAQNTASSLSDIVSGIMESGQIVEQIAVFSQEQSQAVHEINTGIEQIAQVIQSNSATAEQLAAASETMSAQSKLLHDLTSQFTLKASPDRLAEREKKKESPSLTLPA